MLYKHLRDLRQMLGLLNTSPSSPFEDWTSSPFEFWKGYWWHLMDSSAAVEVGSLTFMWHLSIITCLSQHKSKLFIAVCISCVSMTVSNKCFGTCKCEDWTLRVRESVRLEKTLKIIKSNHQPGTNIMFTTKSCPQVPYPCGFWALPDMRTPPLSWAIYPRAGQPFAGRNFPNIPPKPLLTHLETVCPCLVPCYLGAKPDPPPRSTFPSGSCWDWDGPLNLLFSRLSHPKLPQLLLVLWTLPQLCSCIWTCWCPLMSFLSWLTNWPQL